MAQSNLETVLILTIIQSKLELELDLHTRSLFSIDFFLSLHTSDQKINRSKIGSKCVDLILIRLNNYFGRKQLNSKLLFFLIYYYYSSFVVMVTFFYNS